MKRNFMLLCVSALVLALGLSTTAGAETGATAAKKGKACKGKAGRSAAATAQAKKKGKGCAKGKARGTALRDGTYEDAAQSLTLTVSGGDVVLEYSLPSFCETAVTYTGKPVPFSESGDTWRASENRYFSLFGEPATAQWNLAVKKTGLEYTLSFKLEGKAPVGPCEGRGNPKGTLTKVG